MKDYSKDKIAILIDFDGTITSVDTNDLLIGRQTKKSVKEIADREEQLNFMDFFNTIWKEIDITEEEYTQFMTNEIEMTEGFLEFYENTKLNNIPLAIISGGFENGIRPFLQKYGVEDIDIYANKLIFNEDEITVDFYHNLSDCCEIGYCGNCKVLHYNSFKERGYTVVFIGDGITDRAIAGKADIVFAKDNLITYCEENDIDYIPWKDFNDIFKTT